MKGGTETAEKEIGAGEEGTLGSPGVLLRVNGGVQAEGFSAWVRRKAALVLREERWKN